MYKNLEYWEKKVAIVTDAGHEIGGDIAQHLINIGMVVIGFEPTEGRVAQMCEKFASSKGVGQLVPCKCDVTKEEDLKNAFKGIIDTYGGVDVLINNAAVGVEGLISAEDKSNLKNVIDVNIDGLMACPRLAIQSMSKKEADGLVININNIYGNNYDIGQGQSINDTYTSSKTTMTVGNEPINDEHKSLDCTVRVTNISPGIEGTGKFKTAGVKFLNEEYFDKTRHLKTKGVSDIVLMVLAALHELSC